MHSPLNDEHKARPHYYKLLIGKKDTAAITAEEYATNNIMIGGQVTHTGKLVLIVIDAAPAITTILRAVQPHTPSITPIT